MCFKKEEIALAGWLSYLELFQYTQTPNVTSSIPSQGAYLVAGLLQGEYRRQPMDVSLSQGCFSLSRGQ